MIGITVKSNIKAFTKRLTRVQRKQVPFATAGGLNDTAFQVRRRIIERTYPRAFTVRNRRFAGQVFRVKKARKNKPHAAVFDRLGRASLDLHAAGGTKRAKGGHLAAPSDNIRRTASGKVGKAKRPSAIMSSGRAFKGKTRSGKSAIYQRGRGKRGKVQLMYTLIRSARLTKRFAFYEDAAKTARRAFPHNFRKRLKAALRTARL